MDFCETYAQTRPHEHLVKERVDEAMFLDIVRRELWHVLCFAVDKILSCIWVLSGKEESFGKTE